MTIITVIPVRVKGDIKPGKKSLAAIISKALGDSGVNLQEGDILVVAQKIVSKAEGRVVDLAIVKPSPKALRLAKKLQKDARLVELILQESKEIVIVKNGIIITETRHGFVCANSGVDQSNLGDENSAVLLPVDPDRSAKMLRDFFHVAVVITDTFGRPFREGQANVAVGVAGIRPIKSYIGKKDMFGRRLHVTEIAVADEIASAAELAMGKSGGIPVAVVRGYGYEKDTKASSKPLVRKKKTDLFRRSGGG